MMTLSRNMADCCRWVGKARSPNSSVGYSVFSATSVRRHVDHVIMYNINFSITHQSVERSIQRFVLQSVIADEPNASFKLLAALCCTTIGVRDGGRGKGSRATKGHIPPKFWKIFSGNFHVKFGHTVNIFLSYIFAQKCLPPKLTELPRLCPLR